MNISSKTYESGRAKEILNAVKLFNSDLSKKELSVLYNTRLKQLGYSDEEAAHWKDFYFDEVV